MRSLEIGTAKYTTMTTFSGSSRILKGVLAAFDLTSPTPTVIVFQHNPFTLTRTLQAQVIGGERGRMAPVSFKGALWERSLTGKQERTE